MSAQNPWWYISFATDDAGFLGACIVQAADELGAVMRYHELKISPGGQALICGPFPGDTIRRSGMPVNKLLTKEQIYKPMNLKGEPV